MQFSNIVKGRRKFVVLPLLLVLIPTAAWAAFVLLFGFTGAVSTASVTPTIQNVSTGQMTDAACTITKTNEKTVNVSMTKAFPGASCQFSVGMINGQPTTTQDAVMVAQGITFVNSPYVTTKFDAGSCGLQGNASTVKNATFTVKIASDAPMGTTFPADSNVGITLVPQASYVVANCPTW